MNQTLNNLHFLYSFLLTVFLTLAALIAGINTKNILIPLLFIPLTLYFISNFYRRLYQWLLEANSATNPHSFHFLHFITQNNPLYLITLGLLILAFTLSIIKGLLLP